MYVFIEGDYCLLVSALLPPIKFLTLTLHVFNVCTAVLCYNDVFPTGNLKHSQNKTTLFEICLFLSPCVFSCFSLSMPASLLNPSGVTDLAMDVWITQRLRNSAGSCYVGLNWMPCLDTIRVMGVCFPLRSCVTSWETKERMPHLIMLRV